MKVIHCEHREILCIPNKNGCYINEFGDKYYFRNNKLHRYHDLPAIEGHCGSKSWFMNDKRHRLSGPAVDLSYGQKWWVLFDVEYTESEYNTLVSNIPLLYWMNRDMLWE